MQRFSPFSVSFLLSFSDGLLLPLVAITVAQSLSFDLHILVIALAILVLFYAAVMTLSFYFTKKEHQATNINTATFQNIGLSATTETALLQEHLQEQADWKNLTEKEPHLSSKTLLAIALGYVLSGELLLVIYALTAIHFQLKVLWCSAVLLMILTAYAKAKITDGSFLKTIITQIVYSVLLAVLGVFIISKTK